MTERKFWMQAQLFGDGANGMAMQVHTLHEGETAETVKPLGIVMTWSRKDRGDKGTRTFTFDGKDYETWKEALAAHDAKAE